MAKWKKCSNGRERARDNQRAGLKKGEKKKMEEHNEGRTENMRKSNLQRVEDQSVSEMDSEAERKVWENGEKKTPLIQRDFCPNIF